MAIVHHLEDYTGIMCTGTEAYGILLSSGYPIEEMTRLPELVATFETGPYLQAALFCERVLDEKDNVKSLIRLVDRLVVQATGPDVPDTMPEITRQVIAFLSFKSGEAVGTVPIKITLKRPSGMTDPNPVW